MKKQTNTVKQILSKVMLVVILLTSVLGLSGCGLFPYELEVYSHKAFVESMEKYNSLHDIYVNTFISFDLDDNDQVTKRLYSAFAMTSATTKSFQRKHGYITDIHEDILSIRFLFYIISDNIDTNESVYKVKCNFNKVPFNYTQDDKIEFLPSGCECPSSLKNRYDLVYEESFFGDGEEVRIYNYVYNYSIYVNDTKACCIHISTKEETREEELNRIIKMLEDSLVVINTEKNFIWRDKE